MSIKGKQLDFTGQNIYAGIDVTIQQVMASKAHNVLVTRRAFSNAPISLLSSINEFKPKFNFNFKCYLID